MRNLGQLDQQVSEDVFLCLNGESFIICIRVVQQLQVQICPDASDDLSSELKDVEGRLLALTELQSVRLVLPILLLYQALQVGQVAFNCRVPEVLLAA